VQIYDFFEPKTTFFRLKAFLLKIFAFVVKKTVSAIASVPNLPYYYFLMCLFAQGRKAIQLLIKLRIVPQGRKCLYSQLPDCNRRVLTLLRVDPESSSGLSGSGLVVS